MVIEGSFYRITPVNDTGNFFDLELLYDVGGKNPRQEFKNAGYGRSLESTIDAIIRYGITKKFKDEIITLKQYLQEYKLLNKQLRNEISL